MGALFRISGSIMANSDKNLTIRPEIGAASQTTLPSVRFNPADGTTAGTPITLNVSAAHGGTLAFNGSAGQLFSVDSKTTSLPESVFSINSKSGQPVIEIDERDAGVFFNRYYGHFNIPNKLGFFVRNSTAANAFAASSVATFDVVDYNNGAPNGYGFTNSDRFIAPWAGIYFFSWQMLTNQNLGGYTILALNGTAIDGTYHENQNTGQSFQNCYSQVVLSLNKDDYIQARTGNNGGYGSSYSNFMGFQVG